MAFADSKNDFVFGASSRRIRIFFEACSTICSSGRTIEAIEVIRVPPSEQLPLVIGAKLSILDVRCKDRRERPREDAAHPRPRVKPGVQCL
jgi:hypothetical protein